MATYVERNGTYTIQETKTNESYLLTDGEARTFEIREDGVTVSADVDGGELIFRDQVIHTEHLELFPFFICILCHHGESPPWI